MDKLLLNSYVSIYTFSEVVALILCAILLFITIKAVLKWDFNSTSKEQYTLEKSIYLGSIISNFLLTVKVILLIYLVYTLDSISIYIPGAMCAAGVVSANSYGMVLLGVKFLTIATLVVALTLERYDLEAKYYPIFKTRSYALLLVVFLILLEGYLDFAYLSNIDINAPVSCCSTLYGTLEGHNPLPFGLDMQMLLVLLALLFISLVILLLIEIEALIFIIAPLFVVVSYYSVVYFFGTYIYELPTHKCPFCMMQKEYYYVGYLIWGSLAFGVLFSLDWALLKLWLKADYKKLKKLSIWLLSIFIVLNSSYVLIYYLKNGVLL
jgi:hypothetical protein